MTKKQPVAKQQLAAKKQPAAKKQLAAKKQPVASAPPAATVRPTRTRQRVGEEGVVESLLAASRALVGLAARSLADLDADVTLPQYRALVVIATRGPQRVVDIAAELGVNPSTGTRMCDRLVRKGLARRNRSTTDRRAVRLTLTAAGRDLVDAVTRRRREELSSIVAAMPRTWYGPLTNALRAFATAAGEPRETEWWLGWGGDGEEAAAAG